MSAKWFAVLLLFAPLLVVAHDGARTYEKDVGNYRVDIHYPFDPRADVPIYLNFFLRDRTDETYNVPFTDAKIAIANGREKIFEVHLMRKEGLASAVTVVFPEPGTYTLEVAFNDGERELVATSFPITVAPEVREKRIIDFNKELALGFLAGVLLTVGFVWLRRYLPEDT